MANEHCQGHHCADDSNHPDTNKYKRIQIHTNKSVKNLKKLVNRGTVGFWLSSNKISRDN